ncbi:hypothetical protein Cob_v010050 [Colletotrichum orbiculare MAFF 240422]|uniref:Clr5 domain-containing protein n=2 Tax=Colletotrichum orbiculare species complex TaxID=2707354 RepID=N4VCM7_COLOR|nr:hypothetical protein Cob_v010050 [Colletotrichum orbiculare MAFF 240422]
MTKAWKDYREVITRLYIHESKTLDEVKEIMQRDYNFKASTRSYRQRFDQWNLEKYNCKKRNDRRQQQTGPDSPSPNPNNPDSGPDYDPMSPHSIHSLSPDIDHRHHHQHDQHHNHSLGADVMGQGHYTYASQPQPQPQQQQQQQQHSPAWDQGSRGRWPTLPTPPADFEPFYMTEVMAPQHNPRQQQQQHYPVLQHDHGQRRMGSAYEEPRYGGQYHHAIQCAYRNEEGYSHDHDSRQ